MSEGNPHSPNDALDALCSAYGVAPEYNDIWGKKHRASDATRLALLKALGAIDEKTGPEAALHAHEAEKWREVLPPVAVFRGDETPYRLRLRFGEAHERATFQWKFALEQGDVRSGEFQPRDLQLLDRREIDGTRYIEVAFDWRGTRSRTAITAIELNGPGLGEDAHVSFVVAPERCYLPPALASGERAWGPAVQLYALRSERNWGMGDFTDLRTVIEQWGHRGAGVVGVNPLHALFRTTPRTRARTARRRGFSSTCCISTSKRSPTRASPPTRSRRWARRSFSRRCRPHAAPSSWITRLWQRSSCRCSSACTGISASIISLRKPSAGARSGAFRPKAARACTGTRCSKRCRSTFTARTRPSGAGPRGPKPTGVPMRRKSGASRRPTPSASSSTSTCSGRPRCSSSRRGRARGRARATASACIRTSRSRSTAAAPRAGRTRTCTPSARASARRRMKSISRARTGACRR